MQFHAGYIVGNIGMVITDNKLFDNNKNKNPVSSSHEGREDLRGIAMRNYNISILLQKIFYLFILIKPITFVVLFI